MKKYKILCLTDHSGHSAENSVYAILSQLHAHPRCRELVVASRGNMANTSFFKDYKFDKIYGAVVNSSFKHDNEGKSYYVNSKIYNTEEFDIVLMRLPRPMSDDFLLGLKDALKTPIFINDPAGMITCSSKAFLLNFTELCPPIKLCHSIEDVREFTSQYDTVLKPLRDYGGRGLLKITGQIVHDGESYHATDEYLDSIKVNIEKDGYIAMKYLENVRQGDKRLIVVGGEIMAASLRLPPDDSWLCNVALGGTSVTAEADENEKKIVKDINPLLEENGILIYGVDTLMGDDNKRILSEINTLSIGGFPQSEKQTGQPIIKRTLNKIIEYVDARF
jgi:glutathione synthase